MQVGTAGQKLTLIKNAQTWETHRKQSQQEDLGGRGTGETALHMEEKRRLDQQGGAPQTGSPERNCKGQQGCPAAQTVQPQGKKRLGKARAATGMWPLHTCTRGLEQHGNHAAKAGKEA